MVEQGRQERLARLCTLARRGLEYWKGALLVFAVGAAIAISIAANVKRTYRSECTAFAKARIRTDDRDDSGWSPDQALRQSARLKDMLTTRARLESAVRKFGLYPQTIAAKTMLDAVEEMKTHVGFRALEGAQYVISFDGEDPDTVRDVTKHLSESLIDDYAAGDLDDLKREADFLANEESGSLSGLEDSTKALTIFVAAHPEFALEAKQAATTPFGPNPAAGIPLLAKTPGAAEQATSDPQLAALYRERARIEAQARSSAAVARAVAPAVASGKPLDDPIVQAQADVEAAARRVAEAQADLAAKSNLTEDHPDMRASRLAAGAAARQLHEAKVKLASLQQARASGTTPEVSGMPPDVAERLRQVSRQIAGRTGRVRSAPARNEHAADPQPSPQVTAVVELETEWQRLLRALNDAKAHHDDRKQRAERANLSYEAARIQANERMAIVDPPFRPTHPTKGGRTNAAVAGLVMSLLFAIAYVVARVSIDDRLVDSDDAEALGVALLGTVPIIAKQERTNAAA